MKKKSEPAKLFTEKRSALSRGCHFWTASESGCFEEIAIESHLCPFQILDHVIVLHQLGSSVGILHTAAEQVDPLEPLTLETACSNDENSKLFKSGFLDR